MAAVRCNLFTDVDAFVGSTLLGVVENQTVVLETTTLRCLCRTKEFVISSLRLHLLYVSKCIAPEFGTRRLVSANLLAPLFPETKKSKFSPLVHTEKICEGKSIFSQDKKINIFFFHQIQKRKHKYWDKETFWFCRHFT